MGIITLYNFAFIGLTLVIIYSMLVVDTLTCISLKKRTVMVPITLMFLLLVTRDRGWDFLLYQNIFEGIKFQTEGGWIEPGFQIFILGIKYLGGGFDFFNVVFSLTLSILLYFVAIKEEKHAIVVVCVFFLVYYFRGPYGQIRQAFAMLLFLYSLRFVHSNSSVYFGLNLLALSFHSVAFATFPAFFILRYFNMKKKSFITLLLMLMVFYLLNFSEHILTFSSSLIEHPLLMKVKFYLENANIKGGWMTPDIFRILTVSFLIAFILPSFSKLTEYELLLVLAFTIGAATYVLISFDLRLASRLSRIFIIVEILLWARFFEHSSKKSGLFVLLTLYGCVFLLWELYIMSKAEVIYSWS